MKKTPDSNAAKTLGRPRCPNTDLEILKAALRQLATEGYSRMSVDAVAAEAGTTKPTIYRRWPTKADLAVAALAHLQSRAQPELTGDMEQDLWAVLRDFQTKLLRPNGMAMIGTLLVEERHTPELIDLFRQRIVQPRRKLLLKILAQARARDELAPDADPEVAVNMIVGSFYARYLTGDGIPHDWAKRVTATVLNGLRK